MQAQTAAIADAILLGWKGVEGLDGKPLPVTPENKALLLTSVELRDWINLQATDVKNFQREARREDADDLKSGAKVAPGVGAAPQVFGATGGADGQDPAGAASGASA